MAASVVDKNVNIVKRMKKIEILLDQKEYVAPKKRDWPKKAHSSAANHPWRTDFAVWTLKRQLKQARINKSKSLVGVS
jgi:hypothetical protein